MVRKQPAAFGRLCVETFKSMTVKFAFFPAAFGRLCVEKAPKHFSPSNQNQPPSGGCVLKQVKPLKMLCKRT